MRQPTTLWTAREDTLICKLRARGHTNAEITEKLLHRTHEAIEHRFRHLMKQGRVRGLEMWTAREDALICNLRAHGKGLDEIAPKLPNRTRAAISKRILHLIADGQVEPRGYAKLGRRRWTTREDALLVQLRARCAPIGEIMKRLPERTRSAITTRIETLIESGAIERAARSPQSRRPWSVEDDRKLAHMRRNGKTMEDIAAALNRSLPSVNGRIAQRVRKGELPLLGQEKTPPSETRASPSSSRLREAS